MFLVDTPGVGSIYQHNTEAARAFMAESDAAIFITSADPAISDAERVFLEEIREHASRLFFVLNKVDYLTGLDRDEAIAFTTGVIADAVGRDIALYPVSARRALVAKLVGDDAELEASGLTLFERDFRSFLLGEKGQTILDSVRSRGLRLVDDERNSVDIEERALELSAREIDDARHRMEDVFVEARARQRDVHALLQEEIKRLMSTLDRDLADLRAEEAPRALRLASERIDRVEDVRRGAEEIDPFVKETLQRDIERWRRVEEEKIGAAFRDSTARFVHEADRIERETVRLCGDILGIELASDAGAVELSPYTRFTFDFSEVPTILESILPDVRRFLPRGAARRLLERDLRGRIPELVDKHSGRLRWDFLQRLEQTGRELELALDRRLEATIASLLAGIERSVKDRMRSDEEAGRARDRMPELRSRLADLRRVLLGGESGDVGGSGR